MSLVADQFVLTIVENDILADFEQGGAALCGLRLALDGVIHIGSSSKTLSASARCGVATRPEWIDELTDMKIATPFGGGDLAP